MNTCDEDIEADDKIIAEEGERELYEHFRFVADKGQNLLRVDKFLVARLESSSRNRVQQAAEAGCILVNGKAVKSNYRVKPLDVVSVVMDRPRYEFEIIPQDIPLDVVYEDKTVLVVNKPAGLVVHPGHGNYSGTLVNALAYYFRDTPDYDVSDPRLGLVHRIDKDTSGLLVIAKTPEAKTNLGLQFFHKTTQRQYVALVWGIMEKDEGTITGNIGRSLKDRLQMTVFPEGDFGKHAVTHYKTLERLGYAAAGGGAVSATVTGKMEVKNIEIKPEVIDPDDAEMLGDLVAAAVNEALRAAANEKEEKLGAISGGMSLPGIL